jgi:hypothetical protein
MQTDNKSPDLYGIAAIMVARLFVVQWTERNRRTWHIEVTAVLTPAGAPGGSDQEAVEKRAVKGTRVPQTSCPTLSSQTAWTSSPTPASSLLLEGKTTIREKPVSTFSEHKATPDNVPDVLGLANLETLDLTTDVLDGLARC